MPHHASTPGRIPFGSRAAISASRGLDSGSASSRNQNRKTSGSIPTQEPGDHPFRIARRKWPTPPPGSLIEVGPECDFFDRARRRQPEAHEHAVSPRGITHRSPSDRGRSE